MKCPIFYVFQQILMNRSNHSVLRIHKTYLCLIAKLYFHQGPLQKWSHACAKVHLEEHVHMHGSFKQGLKSKKV